MINKNNNFYFNSYRKAISIALVFVIVSFIFLMPAQVLQNTSSLNGIGVVSAHAQNEINNTNDQVQQATYSLGATVVLGIATLFGKLLSLAVRMLVLVASIQNFTKLPAVITGWGVVRDICNMFFILILLVIAFATILRVENYSAKRLLPKLLIMAVVINFSKLIAGLMIDFGQVIMLTFINGLGASPEGVFIHRLNTHVTLSFTPTEGAKASIGFLESLHAVIGGLVVLIISLVVICILAVVLVVRVVMLWILVILSPLAFMASVLPSTGKYASQWWQEFVKWVVVGPMVAFFVWLALVGMATNDQIYELAVPNDDPNRQELDAVGNEALQEKPFFAYIITVALLMGGLMAAQQAGGLAGSMAGNAIGRIKSSPGQLGRWSGKKVGEKAADLGVHAVNRDSVRNLLGRVGGTGGLARGLGVSSLAAKGLIGLDKRTKVKEEDAVKYVNSIKDDRILKRLANGSAVTSWQKAVKDVAQDKMPSALAPNKARDQVRGMSSSDFSKVGLKEIANLGKNGVTIEGEALDYLQSNRVARRAYNEGVHLSGLNSYVTGLNRDGTNNDDLGFKHSDFNYSDVVAGNTPTFTPDMYKYIRGVGPNAGKEHRYRKVEGDEVNKPRGAGNLSVGNKQDGESLTIACNYDKLDVKEIKENENDRYEDIKGTNIKDNGTMKLVAEKLIGAIDSELASLKVRFNSLVNDNALSEDQKRLKHEGLAKQERNLVDTKTRLQNPESIKKLRLINSSAHGFTSMRDAKNTLAHEESHDYIRNEKDTEKMTQYILDNKLGASREKIFKEYASSGKNMDEFLENHSSQLGLNAPKRKKVDEVITFVGMDFKPSDKSDSGFSAKIKSLMQSIPGFSNKNIAKSSNELGETIKSINKAVKEEGAKMTGGLGKASAELEEITSIDTENSTPLEKAVVIKQVQKIN